MTRAAAAWRTAAVVAGLADQGVLVLEAGQGSQAQLLVVTLQGDLGQQGGGREALGQRDAGRQLELALAARQQGDEMGMQLGRGTLVEQGQQAFGVVETRQGGAADPGVDIPGQPFEGLALFGARWVEAGSRLAADPGVGVLPARRKEATKESRH